MANSNEKVSVNRSKLSSSLYSTPQMWEREKQSICRGKYFTSDTSNGCVIVKILFCVAEVCALRFNEANELKGAA